MTRELEKLAGHVHLAPLRVGGNEQVILRLLCELPSFLGYIDADVVARLCDNRLAFGVLTDRCNVEECYSFYQPAYCDGQWVTVEAARCNGSVLLAILRMYE